MIEFLDVWDSVHGGYPLRAGIALVVWVVGSIILLRRKNYAELTVFFLVSAMMGSIISSQGQPMPMGLRQGNPQLMQAVATGWSIQAGVSLLLAVVCFGATVSRFVIQIRNRRAASRAENPPDRVESAFAQKIDLGPAYPKR